MDALNTCGGEAQITVSPDMKNDVPFKVYADPGHYEWLLGQEKIGEASRLIMGEFGER